MGFKHFIIASACLTWLAGAQEKAEPESSKAPKPPTAEDLAARQIGIRTSWKNALNVAHQIAASQGYRRRDTHWKAALPSEGFTVVPLQLYAGNEYYIILGTDGDTNQISASAFDPERMLVKTAPDRGEGKLLLRLKPERSGTHYLRIHHKEKPTKPVHAALTYLYK